MNKLEIKAKTWRSYQAHGNCHTGFLLVYKTAFLLWLAWVCCSRFWQLTLVPNVNVFGHILHPAIKKVNTREHNLRIFAVWMSLTQLRAKEEGLFVNKHFLDCYLKWESWYTYLIHDSQTSTNVQECNI